MSISTQKPGPEEEADFADIEFCKRPDTPEPEVKPENVEQPEAPQKEQPTQTPAEEEAKEESTSKSPAPETEEETQKEETKANKKKNGEKSGAKGVLFDALLVLLLLAVLGGGGYYVKQQMELYRVPTPMEIALLENARLQKQHDELLDAYYRADEQIAMRKRLAEENAKLAGLLAECHKLEASIAGHRNNVLAMQHDIRTADKESRAIANSLLPGLPIGDAVTSRGLALRAAVIYRLEGKLITLRSPEGQIRVPLRELVKKDLPRLARYAFGEIDLIDMSDFDANGNAPDKATDNTPAPTPTAAVRTEPDYEQSSGAPTVDTGAGSTITAPAAPASSGATWEAPTGELPF